ncbi:MAG: tRNA 2-thiocytidine biosynthesis TtcA family protein [Bacillota bacterium]|jgi:tRNA 2-thiocytidine biosynthesis protein TtcA
MGLPFHQHLFPPVKKLVWEYDMLREGDRVAVGVSGGKDSLTALYTLAMLRSMIPVSYSLTAITVDMGWPGSDWTGLRALCGQLGVPLHVVSTQIAAVLFEQRRETNPCSLCSKMRHGALNDTAKKLGCNVVALGHHSDDAVETVFLNMFYAGRIACFNPVTELDRTGLRLIRPMLYISEKTTARVARKLELPVSHNPCPANGNSKRQHIKEMLAQQAREDKLIPRRLQAAVKALWRQHL